MADIDIEKKNPVWPWILAAVVIAIILIIIFVDSDSAEEPVAGDEPVETTIGASAALEGETANLISEEENVSAVEDYATFINNMQEMGLDHNYTHDALLRLTEAIEALANEVNYEVNANLSRVRQIAQEITSEPYSDQHGNKLTEAFRILTNALMGLQQANYPTLSEEVTAMDEDISQLEEIASNLNPEQLTLEQKEIIKSYFSQAAEVLTAMN